MVTREQKWEDRKMVRTPHDEITIGTEHWRSEEWKTKGRVAGAKLKPDLVWLWRDSGDAWKKVVVDVMITSIKHMKKSFKEKDDKYRVWATEETREKKVGNVTMAPLIISHDGAIHKDSVKRWENIAPDIKVGWVRMAQSVLRYNVVIVGRFFNKGSWASEAWRKEHPEELVDEQEGPPERLATSEDRRKQLDLEPTLKSAVCVRPSGTPPPHGVRPMSAENGNSFLPNARTNQPI